jgi:hypothetical protein
MYIFALKLEMYYINSNATFTEQEDESIWKKSEMIYQTNITVNFG